MMRRVTVLRILDANLNRAREAVRVLEDLVRFGPGDARAVRELRAVRHGLSTIGDALALLSARDAAGDVGRESPPAPARGLGDLAFANFKRLEEALRSIEECGRASDRAVARRAQAMRFRAYALESRVVPPMVRRDRLEVARVYVLLIEHPRLLWIAAKAVEGGADVIQLRASTAWLPKLRKIAAGRLLIVNDVPAKADGIHLGRTDMAPARARSLLGPRAIIGVTTHSFAEARAAVRAGADYISIGPMYASKTKPDVEPRGFSYLSRALKLGVPAFAIGGIDARRAAALARRGVTRVAVCDAVTSAADPARAVRAIRRALIG